MKNEVNPKIALKKARDAMRGFYAQNLDLEVMKKAGLSSEMSRAERVMSEQSRVARHVNLAVAHIVSNTANELGLDFAELYVASRQEIADGIFDVLEKATTKG